MKIFTKSLLCVALFAGLVSCGKDSENGDNSLNVNSITNSKWVMESGSKFTSIELNKSGNYIAVRAPEKRSVPSGDVFFGKYQIVSQTIVLEGLGTITFTEIKDDKITFTLTLTGGGTPIGLSADKATEMASSTQTDLLCRTWELIKYDGVNVKGTDKELTILFSKAGTHFIRYVDGNTESPVWRWTDNNQTQFQYSWDDWDGDIGVVEVTNLTSTELITKDKESGIISVFKGL